MQIKTSLPPAGFAREDLEAVADSLENGYDRTVNVGNVTGEGDEHCESTTAYAARFIRAMLNAGAPGARIPFAGHDTKFCPGSNPDNPQPPDEQGAGLRRLAQAAREAYFPSSRHGHPSFDKLDPSSVEAWERVAAAVIAAQGGAELSDEQIERIFYPSGNATPNQLLIARSIGRAVLAARGGAK